MGARRIRREQRQYDQRMSRIVNGHKKRKERERREKRMVELIKNNDYPYTPAIMSWISQELNKPSRRITEDDVKQLVASK